MQEVKTAYRASIRKYHPDVNPAGLEMSKVLNTAYDALKAANMEHFDTTNSLGYDEALNDAINTVMGFPDIEIEVCGIWVWLSGDTKPCKEELKAAGYRWASKKKRWYFRPPEFKSRNRGRYSMDDIRAKYGSATQRTEERKKIA